MAASNLNLGKASGGVLNIQPADGVTNTSIVLPTSGTVVATDVAVTDNAIARYDGTTGKVQNSGVIIDDNGNVGIGTVNTGLQSEQLHIANSTAPKFMLSNTTGYSWSILVPTNNGELKFKY